MAEVSWSVSRNQILGTCERRYYFQYVAKARINSRDGLLKEIAYLKKLKSIAAWQGDIFHQLVASWVRGCISNNKISESALKDTATQLIEKGWFESEQNSLQKFSSKSTRLFEHEYGISFSDDKLSEITERELSWISEFFRWQDSNGLVESLKSSYNVWVEPPIFGLNVTGFKIESTQVIVKVDLATISKEGIFEIWDWKTGKVPQENPYRLDPGSLQVNVYQLWPNLTLNVPLENIHANLVYVSASPIINLTKSIDADIREYTLSLVRKSIEQVKRLSTEYDRENLSLQDFDYAPNSALCRFCSFKRLCTRFIEGGY
ncbi:PD-(D/E)XK nuclease family protein [Chloroflexota bacterium]